MKALAVIQQNAPLTYQEGLASPCASCATSPCCTYLPLHTFQITNMMELDHAVYLLNFDKIELGLSSIGEWSVYYRYPCRFLDRQDFTCTIHNSPEQPNVCVHYNPYSCWYKRALTPTVTEDFLRIDRQRMAFILERVVFDESRNIIEVPVWEALVEAFENLPIQENSQFSPQPSREDLSTGDGEGTTPNPSTGEDAWGETFSYEDETLRNPCSGCQAYCCKTLVFPVAAPESNTSLDFLKFCLGFPGIELDISDGGWSIVVKTTCRHLQNNLCSIYGQPERPLICNYYDAWKCTYKPLFGTAQPEGFLRVTLKKFARLSECFQFDSDGSIVEFPPTEAMKEHVVGKVVQHIAEVAPVL